MWQVFKNSQGSVILRGKLRDTTTGNGKTGLTSASSGLIISTIADNEAAATAYSVASSKVETISTLGTYAAPTSTKCRFKEVDATNHPGIYEIQIADARFAVAGAKSLLVSVSGVSGMFDMDGLIPLWLFDPNTATPNVNATNIGGTAAGSATLGFVGAVLGDVSGRVLGNTTTSFSGVGVQADVEQWKAGTVPSPNVTGVPIVDIKYTAGVQVFNADGTLASAASTTVTFPALDSAGSTVPDNGQFAWHEVEINGGTGRGQRVILTTATGTARQYNVLSGTLPLGADSTSTYVMHDSILANVTHLAGTLQTARDVGLSVLLSVGVGTGQVNLSSGKVPATLAASDVSGNVAADLQTIKTQTVTAAGGVTFPAATLASTTNITAGTITTATTVGTVNALAANVITAASIAADAGTELAAAVWDLATSGHTTSGSFGAAMVAAGSAGDPWATSLPGSYGAGTAGHRIGLGIPDILAGAASGLVIAGANAATTFATLTSTGAFTVNGVVSVPQTGDNFTRIGVAGAGLTALGDTRLANLSNLDAQVSTRSTLTAANILTTTLTESYAADGAAFTLSQALYEICQAITEFGINGVTITAKKRDGITTAAIYTMDSATVPTSRTRSA